MPPLFRLIRTVAVQGAWPSNLKVATIDRNSGELFKWRMGDPPGPLKNRLIRIRPDQVLCKVLGCENAASFILYESTGEAKPAVLAYCEDHAKPIAKELGISLHKL